MKGDGSIPLSFEPNQGQAAVPSPFLVHVRDGSVYLQPGGLLFKLLYRDSETGKVLADTASLRFRGAAENTVLEGREILPGTSNYLIGNDPTRWRTDIPQYARMHTQGLYPEIDADFYSEDGRLEYDFVLEPGADPSQILMQFDGHEPIQLSGDGDLILHLRGGDLIQRRPMGYQLKGGIRHPVSVRYRLREDQSIAFELGAYDSSLPLIIDPSFVYSTRFGGSRQDEPRGIAVDSTGAAYVTGLTYSPDFPTAQPIQSRNADIYGQTPDVFISKFNPAGTQLIYSTYLGGSKDDLPNYIAVDPAGSAYVTGSTISVDFPVFNAMLPNIGAGGEGFIVKLNPAGSGFIYSSYFPGGAIAVDSVGAAYVGAAPNPNLPITNAFQPRSGGGRDAFLLKINPSGTALGFSTFFGGTGDDYIDAIALEPSTGNIVIAGGTTSPDLPTLHAFQPSLPDTRSSHPFVAKFNSTASALIYSSLLSGSLPEYASGIAVDSSGNAFVTGSSESPDFPTTAGALEPFPGSVPSCFISKVSNTGALLASTFLNSHYGTGCSGIALDSTGNVLVAGGSTLSDYPVFGAVQRNSDSGPDAFLTKLAPDLSSMIYSTLLGVNTGASGIAVDANNAAYVAVTVMGTYPIVNSMKLGPGAEIGVSKIVDDSTCAGTVVSPVSFTVPPSGLSTSVHVSTAPTCIWSASPNTNGPPLNSPDFILGPSQHAGTGDITFTVPFTQYGPDQTGHIVVAGRRIDVTQPGLGCTATLTPSSSVTLPYTATNNQFFTYNVNAGCPWQAQSNAPWITLTPPTSSKGPATIQFSVAAYLAPPGPPRSGTITIAGQTFTVNQSTIPPPTLSIRHTHIGNFPPGQQNATYTVIVSNPSSAGPTNAPVTVTEMIPYGFTLVSMSGPGWSCSTNTCNRSDVLSPGASYPAISVTVNVAVNATSPQVNQVSVSGGGSASASASDLTLITSAQPKLTVNHTKLNFAYTTGPIFATSALQTIIVNLTNAGPNVGWTATPNQPNILFAGAVTPQVTGIGGGSFEVGAAAGPSGTITIALTNAVGSVDIQVNVNKANPGAPFGSFDTPADNSTGIAGAIPVTGWALDNVEVVSVRIYREAGSGLAFIGDAVFVDDARPDVAALYPNMPNQYGAGWGYSMLTNFLPNTDGTPGLGNGTYKLHAIATNTFGNQVDLGTRTITVDNAHATKPFGTIDTPGQGSSVSGSSYVNFGWALTQKPYCIPFDGSTITVMIDGVVEGHPAYNQNRSDIASLFAGLCNSNGGVGYSFIDTTKLTNGVHTISWVATDNQGHVDGIGSRYFSVSNSGGSTASPAGTTPEFNGMQGVLLRKGYDLSHLAQRLKPDDQGLYVIEMEELDRIELQAGVVSGYLLFDGERYPHPVGSTFKDGVFYWQPGPGFLGNYDVVLERSDGRQVNLRILIRPKNYSRQ